MQRQGFFPIILKPSPGWDEDSLNMNSSQISSCIIIVFSSFKKWLFSFFFSLTAPFGHLLPTLASRNHPLRLGGQAGPRVPCLVTMAHVSLLAVPLTPHAFCLEDLGPWGHWRIPEHSPNEWSRALIALLRIWSVGESQAFGLTEKERTPNPAQPP